MKVEMNLNDENASSSSKYFSTDAIPKTSNTGSALGILLTEGVKNEPAEVYDYEKPVKYEQTSLKHKIKDEDHEDFNLTDKKAKWEPENWRQVFDLIRQMRQGQDAPVDTMGCDALANLDQTLTPKEQRFQVLVSLMLSAQTKDEVTAAATNRLQTQPLNVETMCKTDEETISQQKYPVSYITQKPQ